MSNKTSTSLDILDSKTQIQNLQSKNKNIVQQWKPGHCQIHGNEQADALDKKGTTILQINQQDASYHTAKLHLKKITKHSFQQELLARTSQKIMASRYPLQPGLAKKSNNGIFLTEHWS